VTRGALLRSWAEIDLAAIAHNTRLLAQSAPGAAFCAVVKADGYGHGSVPVARASLAAGAKWLAVAHAAEAVPLRQAGIDAPILLLSEPTPAELADVVDNELRVAVYSEAGVAALGHAASRRSRGSLAVHLKVDTGMHRVGCRPDEAAALALAVERHPRLVLEGVMTHFAMADEPEDPRTGQQLDRFLVLLDELERHGVRPPMRHAANSAGLLAHPASHFDLVRVGIALYGLPPSPALAACADLRPALSLHARVSLVKQVAAGQGVSYGQRGSTRTATLLATLSIGYADGVRRALGLSSAPVLLGGHRHPMLGVVTMDQLVVDCGADAEVEVGDQAVLIGAQGGERIHAQEWADLLGTINYEIVTGLGARLPRLYRSGAPHED
jgi:alanine racemase